MQNFFRAFAPLASVAALTLFILAVTRPNHSLWQLLAISPDVSLSLPMPNQLLSLLSVPLIFLISRAIKPQSTGIALLIVAMVIALSGRRITPPSNNKLAP